MAEFNVLEAVINVSEGRDPAVIAEIGRASGPLLLDVHSDRFHHRSVFTLAGSPAEVEASALGLARRAVELLDLTSHVGVHPRLGVVDVVPFVPYGRAFSEALAARDRFAHVLAGDGVPCFLYGPERTLPEVRRQAFVTLAPDLGPIEPHPTAGACCVGARDVLIAYNLVIDGPLSPRQGDRPWASCACGAGPRPRHRRREPGLVQPHRSDGRGTRSDLRPGGGTGADREG